MAWYGPGGATDDLFRTIFDNFSDEITLTKAEGTVLTSLAIDWHAERFTGVDEILERVGDITTDQWGELLRADGYEVADFPRRTSGRADFGTIEFPASPGRAARTYTIRGVSSTQSHIRLHCDEGKDT